MKKKIELEEVNVIIRVPKNAFKITIKAQLPDHDGEIVKVKKKLTKTDIDAARKAFLDNVEDGDDYDACYVVTEEGLEFLKKLEEREK